MRSIVGLTSLEVSLVLALHLPHPGEVGGGGGVLVSAGARVCVVGGVVRPPAQHSRGQNNRRTTDIGGGVTHLVEPW